MKVNSTGLGNTTLTAHISGLLPGDEPGLLTMKIESTKPVHWYITCRMEPKDIRTAIKMVLKPAALFRILKMALSFPREKVGAEPVLEAKQNG
jgi:hypothetical protein